LADAAPSGYGDEVAVADRVHHWPRCGRCNRVLAEYITEPFSIRCKSCKFQNRAGQVPPKPQTDPR